MKSTNIAHTLDWSNKYIWLLWSVFFLSAVSSNYKTNSVSIERMKPSTFTIEPFQIGVGTFSFIKRIRFCLNCAYFCWSLNIFAKFGHFRFCFIMFILAQVVYKKRHCLLCCVFFLMFARSHHILFSFRFIWILIVAEPNHMEHAAQYLFVCISTVCE